MKKIPKYEAIKNQLIEQIHSGIYPIGSEIPSENELIQQYNVSRITIRRAIDELYLLGYINKKQGRHCYIRRNCTQELSSISSYTEEILRQGMIPSRKVLSSNLRLPNKKEQNLLQLDKSEPIYHMDRVILANQKPLCYTDTILPYKYFRDIENYDFTQNSLYHIIENKYHIKIVFSSLKLKAIAADSYIASHLDIASNVPLLYSSAVTYGIIDNEEVPIEYFTTYYLTDFFEYSLIQKRN